MPPDKKESISDEQLGKWVREGFGALREKVSRRSVLTVAGATLTGAAGYVSGRQPPPAPANDVPAPLAPAPVAAAPLEGSFSMHSRNAEYVIESVHYVCHLEKGDAGPSGKWGQAGSKLLARIHITYTYFANRDVMQTDEELETHMDGATLQRFFSTLAVSGEGEPPSKQRVKVKLAFPMKTGEVKTYATGVDIEYTLPLTPWSDMDTVEVGPQQYFLHYPNRSDYIRYATVTIDSTMLDLSEGQFAIRRKGQSTDTRRLSAQTPCLASACGTELWRPVVTASAQDLSPDDDFGLRVTWTPRRA